VDLIDFLSAGKILAKKGDGYSSSDAEPALAEQVALPRE